MRGAEAILALLLIARLTAQSLAVPNDSEAPTLTANATNTCKWDRYKSYQSIPTTSADLYPFVQASADQYVSVASQRDGCLTKPGTITTNIVQSCGAVSDAGEMLYALAFDIKWQCVLGNVTENKMSYLEVHIAPKDNAV